MKRLLGSEVGWGLPSPEPRNEVLFGKWLWDCEDPLEPCLQVREWWCLAVLGWRALGGVGCTTDLFAGSYSIWLGLVLQPADTQFLLIMACL